MLSEDLRSICVELGTLAGNVDEKNWEFIKKVKQNLEAITSGVEDLEKGVIHG